MNIAKALGVVIFIMCQSSSFVYAQDAKDLAAITLLKPRFSDSATLMNALEKRRSVREFRKEELSLQTISNLLWAANGINRPEQGMRTAPSAKNAQEIDVYVAMKSGLYVYNAKAHQLDPVLNKDIRVFVGIQGFVKDAPISLVLVADYGRLDGSENEKNLYSAMDAAYVSQNAYLYCAAEGLATVVLAWVDKGVLEKEMKLKDEQHIIVTQPVGMPR